MKITDFQHITLPEDRQFLFAGVQKDTLCLWYLVNLATPTTTIKITIYGTGQEITERLGKYLGSCIMYHGDLVLHIFEDIYE